MKKIVSSVCILSIINSTCFLSVLNATTESYGYNVYNNSGNVQMYSGIKDYICSDNLGNVSSNDSSNIVYSPFCALMTGDLVEDAYFSDLDVLVVTGNSTVTSNLLILGGDGGDGGDGDAERSRAPMIISMQALITLMEFMPLILTGFRFQKFIRHARKTGKSLTETIEYFSKKATRTSMVKRLYVEVANGNPISRKIKSFPKKIYADIVDMLPKSLLTKHAKKMKRAFKAVSNLTDESDEMLQLLLREGREVENKTKLRHAFAEFLQNNFKKLDPKKRGGRTFEQMFNSRVFGKQSDMFRKSGAKLRPDNFDGGLVDLMKKNLEDITDGRERMVDDVITNYSISDRGSEFLEETDTMTTRGHDDFEGGVVGISSDSRISDLDDQIRLKTKELELKSKEAEAIDKKLIAEQKQIQAEIDNLNLKKMQDQSRDMDLDKEIKAVKKELDVYKDVNFLKGEEIDYINSLKAKLDFMQSKKTSIIDSVKKNMQNTDSEADSLLESIDSHIKFCEINNGIDDRLKNELKRLNEYRESIIKYKNYLKTTLKSDNISTESKTLLDTIKKDIVNFRDDTISELYGTSEINNISSQLNIFMYKQKSLLEENIDKLGRLKNFNIKKNIDDEILARQNKLGKLSEEIDAVASNNSAIRKELSDRKESLQREIDALESQRSREVALKVASENSENKKVLAFADDTASEKTFSDLIKVSKVKDATDNAEDLLKNMAFNDLYIYHERLDYVEGIMDSLSLQNFALKGYSKITDKKAAVYLMEGLTMRTWPFVVAGVRKTLEKLTSRLLARTDSRGSFNLSKWTQNGFSEAFRAVRGAERRDRFVAGDNLFYGGGGGGFGWRPITGIGSGGGGGGDSYRSTRSGSNYMTKSGGGGSGSYAAGGGGGGACYDTATAYWIFNKAGNGGAASWFAGGGGGGASGTGSGLADWPEGDGHGGDGAGAGSSFSKDGDNFKIVLSGGGGGGGGMRAANMVLSIMEMILEMYVESTISAIPIVGGFLAPLAVMAVKSYYWAVLLVHQGMSHATGATNSNYGMGGGTWLRMFQFPLITPFPYLPNGYNLAGNIHGSRSVSNGLIGQVGGNGASGVVNNFLIKKDGRTKKQYELTIAPNNHAGYPVGNEIVSSNAAGGGGGGGVNLPGGNSIQTWESGASGGGGGGAYPYDGGHNIADDGSAYGGGGWGGNGGSSDLFNVPVSSKTSIPLGALKGGAGGRGYFGGGGGNGGGWIVVKNGVTLNLGRTQEQCVQTNILAQSNSPQMKAFMLYGAAAGSDGENQGGSGGNGGGVMVIDGQVNVNPGYSFIVTRPTPPLKSRGKSGGYVLINNGGILSLKNTSKTSCDIELLNGGTLFVDKLALSYDMDDINDLDSSVQPKIPTLFGCHPTNKQQINIKLQGTLIYGLSQFNFSAVEVPDDYDRAYLFSALPDDGVGIGKIPFKTWNICCDRNADYIVPSSDVTSPLLISKKTQKATYLSQCPTIKKVCVTKITEPNSSNMYYGCLDLSGIQFASDQTLLLKDGGTLIVPTSGSIQPLKITVKGGVLETATTTLTGTTPSSNFFSPFTISGAFAVKTNNVLADNDTGVSCSAIPSTIAVTWQIFGGTESAPQFGTALSSSHFKYIEIYGYFSAAGLTLNDGQRIIVKSGGILDITNADILTYLSKISFEAGGILIASSIPRNLIVTNCSLLLKASSTASIPDVQFLQIAGAFTGTLDTTKSTEIVEGGSINISSITGTGPVVVKERGQILINSNYSNTVFKDITVKDSGIVTYLGATTATTTTQAIVVNDIFKYLKIQDGIFQTNVGVIDNSTGIGNPDIVETLKAWYINSGSYEQTALSANQFSTIRVLSGSILNASGLIMEAGKNLVIDSGATLKLNASSLNVPSMLTILGQLYLKNGCTISKGDGASIVIRSGAKICSDKTDFSSAIADLTLLQGVVLHTTAVVTAGFASVPSQITAWYINSLAAQNLTSAIISAMPKNIHIQGAVNITDSSDVNIPFGYSLFLNNSSSVNFNGKKINIKSGSALFVSSTIVWSDIAANIAFESGSQFVTDVSNFSSFSSFSFSNVNQIGTTEVISDSSNGVSYTGFPESINTWNIYAPFSDFPQKATQLSNNSKITTINIGVFDDGMSGQYPQYPGYLDTTGLTQGAYQTLYVLRGGTLYVPNNWIKPASGTIKVKAGGIIAVDNVSLVDFSRFTFDIGDEGAILQVNSALPTSSLVNTNFKKILINYGALSAPITLIESQVSGFNEVLVAGPFNAPSPGFFSSSCVKSLFNNNDRTLTIMQGGVLCVSVIGDLTLDNSSSKVKLKDGAIVNLDLPTTTGTSATTLVISNLSSKFTFETGEQVLMTSKVVSNHEDDNKFSTWMINAGTETAPQTLVSSVKAYSFSTIIVLNGSFLKWTGAHLGADVSVIVKRGGTLFLEGSDTWPVNVKMQPGSMVKQTDTSTSNWYLDFKKHVQDDVSTSGVVNSSVVNLFNKTVASKETTVIPTDYDWANSGTISVEPNGIVKTNAMGLSILSNNKLTLQYGCILMTTDALTDGETGVLQIPDNITQWYIATNSNVQNLTSLTNPTTHKNKTNLRLIKVLNGAKLNVIGMIIPHDLTVEFEEESVISSTNASDKLTVYGTLFLPSGHAFSNIVVKEGGVLRTDKTDLSNINVTFEAGSILSTTATVTALKYGPYIWNIEGAQETFPSGAPSVVMTKGIVINLPSSGTLRLNQGARLGDNITVPQLFTLFFDRYFDPLTLNKNITFSQNSILATNNRLINFEGNIEFSTSTSTSTSTSASTSINVAQAAPAPISKFKIIIPEYCIFQSHSYVNDDASGIGQIPCTSWQILAENKGFFIQTARTLNCNQKVKNIIIKKYTENGAVKRGFLNGTGLTLTNAQNITVEDGGILYLPKMDRNDKARINGQITIKSAGSLVLDIDADWPTFIKLENGAKVLQNGKATSMPQWYNAFNEYINSQNNNSLISIYLYMNYSDNNSDVKITKLTASNL